jgi:acetylornithine deacetylase
VVPLDLVKTLSELVAIPSVNPMGRQVRGPEYFERRLTAHLEALLTSFDVPVARQAVAEGRDNIAARLDGHVNGPLILLDAHQDTVPVEGMTIDPWNPTVDQARLYGRGACDIKGGMAAVLGAFARLAEDRGRLKPTVIVTFTVNEEHGFTGAQALGEWWTGKRPSIFPRKPDMAIVAEPTRLDIVVAHKGMVRWRCSTRGKAAHSSVPHLGDNAIYRMVSVLTALERYHRDVVPFLGEHPLCGRPSLSVGTIHGGLSVNTVPDSCTVEIDRRLLPGDDAEAAYRHVIEYVAANALAPIAVEHEAPMMVSPGLSNENNGELARHLGAAVRDVVGCVNDIGVAFGTNAAAIGQHCPTVVFGPGSIEQAHTADEWVSLDEVHLASEILYRFIKSFGGLS